MTLYDQLHALTDQAQAQYNALDADYRRALAAAADTDDHIRRLETEIARLQALLDPQPDPIPGYRLHWAADLRTDQGWTHRAGLSTNNAAIRSEDQAQFGAGPDGRSVCITAERRPDGNIYSAELVGNHAEYPALHHLVFIFEVEDFEEGGWPAGWARPRDGNGRGWQGEQDWVELFGRRAGNAATSSRPPGAGTLHATPYPSRHIGVPFRYDAAFWNAGPHRIDFRVTREEATWWVDGVEQGTVTAAEFDAVAGAGKWEAQHQSHPWCPRLSLQYGPGTGTDQTGPVPPWFTRSRLWCHGLRVYVPDA